MINLLIKLVRQAGIEILNIYESDDLVLNLKKTIHLNQGRFII